MEVGSEKWKYTLGMYVCEVEDWCMAGLIDDGAL